ncbi:type III PLP-dependent enzyme [Paenibacillus sp. PR3]|uniref:Type III PLP-dependent enzyme n=1 Tax=Paenibacillus terricola TaxID=2763503 RepID=A0ABR8MUH1_9BACL|nr:type III PLP-dependent enzyme [Paenibacillus terricola]MBD3919255.1 type III PLP-dependent enzyme [Paenibacillus terricola]
MMEQLQEWIASWQRESQEPVCAYVYDLDGIQRHVRSMLDKLPAHSSLFYAIKANPDKRIILALLPLVSGFEVASIGELLKVRDVSHTVPILFGGPGKKDAELDQAILNNVTYLHVESLLELRKLIELAKYRKRTVQVLLRINLRTADLPQTKIRMGGGPSPFGLDETLVEEAISILRENSNTHVKLCGFHFHSLSNNTNAELHAEMVSYYVRKVEEWESQYDIEVSVINAGGGFGVTYDGSPGFDWPLFTRLLKQSEEWNRLGDTEVFFEPGRFIVADHGYYVTEVIDMKLSHEQWFAVIRGGTHHNRLPASWGHDHPFRVVQTEREWQYSWAKPMVVDSNVTIVGELCTPKDRMHTDAQVPRLQVGDVLVFVKSGAYCWTISHHDFLGHPHPTFYYLTEEGIPCASISK